MSKNISKHITNNLIARLGGILHDEWRAHRKKEGGAYEPHQKKTTDQEWIKNHGTEKVDIANTDYADLPEDWKNENKISAEIALTEICEAVKIGRKLNNDFIERASAIIHEKRLKRNGKKAPAEQNKPYDELSEEEKNKDRAIIKTTIEFLQVGQDRRLTPPEIDVLLNNILE